MERAWPGGGNGQKSAVSKASQAPDGCWALAPHAAGSARKCRGAGVSHGQGCPWAGKLGRPVSHLLPWSSLKYPSEILPTTQRLGSDRATRKGPSVHSTTCLLASGLFLGLGNRCAMLFGLNISHKRSTESTPVSPGMDTEDVCLRLRKLHSRKGSTQTAGRYQHN